MDDLFEALVEVLPFKVLLALVVVGGIGFGIYYFGFR